MKFYILFLFLLLTACGSRPTQDGGGYVYKKLSDEEAKKLVTPTIYYIASFDQRNLQCAVEVRRQMKAQSGAILAIVCPEVYKSCVLQGTCRLQINAGTMLLNVSEKIDGEYSFKNMSNSQCRFGHGPTKDSAQSFKLMCLDPYYSVAADLSIYNLGDVIYIPIFAGLKMSNGQTHDGYFIVRDSGTNIKGYGRFDFFLGDSDSVIDRQNFLKLGLKDKNTHFTYFLAVIS